jgi:MFS family permease
VLVRWLTGRMVSSAGWVLPRSHPATQLLVQGQSRVCRRPHSINLTLLMSPPVQPNELSKRLALFYSASLMAGAFGGLLAGVITQYMDGVGNTPGWQWVSRRHPDIWPELWRCAGF